MRLEKSKPTIIVPMAGLGTRFAEAGYTDIKPLIPILGKPMIQHSIESVGIDGNWIFIVQKDHRLKYNLDEVLDDICPNCKVIDTGGGPTAGAACSVLLAEDYIDHEQPMIVVNSDNIIEWDAQTEFDNLMAGESDGLILCFKETSPKWSYARLGKDGYVAEVAEKKVISDNATVGLYIWKHGRDFISAAKEMIRKDIRTNNEFYLCPVYNENILAGQKISICQAETMYGVGTPEDLNFYLSKVK